MAKKLGMTIYLKVEQNIIIQILNLLIFAMVETLLKIN